VVAHLLAVPARADAELEPPVREEVDRRDLLRRGDRVALDDQADAGADPQTLRDGGDRRQRDERVERVPVPPWGRCDSRLAGMWVCSANSRASKPASSAARPSSAGPIE
jgi:hypothetical protein